MICYKNINNITFSKKLIENIEKFRNIKGKKFKNIYYQQKNA